MVAATAPGIAMDVSALRGLASAADAVAGVDVLLNDDSTSRASTVDETGSCVVVCFVVAGAVSRGRNLEPVAAAMPNPKARAATHTACRYLAAVLFRARAQMSAVTATSTSCHTAFPSMFRMR